jgi:hypothetical protein
MMLCFTASAQTLRSPNDPRNQSPTVGTGGPSGGPTGLFTVYDGSTLRKGEYTFSIAYSNYDRDPGNVDLTIIPGSFQVGLNDYVELFFNMDLYRGIKVNTPQNLSSFYLPNSQLFLGPGVLGSAPAIILAPSGPNVGTLSGRAVFRYPLCVNAGCAALFPTFPAGPGSNFNGLRFWGQPFVQYPYVGGVGPNFGQGPGGVGTLFGFPGFSTVLGSPVRNNSGQNFGSAAAFPGIGSPVGSILPGIVLAADFINNTPGPILARQFVPATFTIAPTYLPDAPFINRLYGESSFTNAVVGGKIRLTAPNSPYGFALLPMYRFYLDKADDAAGFSQLQRGASPGGGLGDFGLTAVFDARLSRSVNVAINAGYWLNSNPKGEFPTGEFAILDRPDEFLVGIGFDFPVNKYLQPIFEVRSTQYVGGRTPNAFENSPVDALAGIKIYPRRWFGFGAAYRYHVNQQDRASFDGRTFNTAVNVAVPGGTVTPTTVPATTGDFPRGFFASDNANGFIGQFWIGRRNARVTPTPPNVAPVVKLEGAPDMVRVTSSCGEGQRPRSCPPATVDLRASATDADNDRLLYNWTTTGGRIVGEGANVTWDLSGVQPGTYRANVYVSDGNGHEVCDWVTVKVEDCGCDAAPMPTPPPCPRVSANASPSAVEEGGQVTVSANVSGAQGPVSYNWTVTCGTIISGQGSPTITIDNTGCAGRTVTANVEIGGLRPECPSTAQAAYEVKRPITPIKVSEFPGTNVNKDKAFLDELARQVQGVPGSQAYIIHYGDCGDKGRVLAEKQRAYLINQRGLEAGSIILVDGGCRSVMTFEFFVVPQGATPPSASGGAPCEPCKKPRRKRTRRGDDDD